MSLDLSMETVAEYTVVRPVGQLDVYTAPTLKQLLAEVRAGDHPRVVVDLDRVEQIDSSGLAVLAAELKGAEARGGWLRLVCSVEALLKTLRITGLDGVFAIYDSVPEAIEAG